MAVDPRTPVLVGVGQFTENIDDPDYRGMSSVELATEAAKAALADTGADVDAVAKAIEVFVGLRQFEICTPYARAAGQVGQLPAVGHATRSAPAGARGARTRSAARVRRSWSRSSPARSPTARSRS